MPMNEKQVLSEQYQQKTDKEHILDNPDTYIGSIENVDSQMWVYDEDNKSIKLKTIEYIPGLYKLFDEGIVNSRDHVVRMIQSALLNKIFVSQIKVNITKEGLIEIYNDGNGIDIAKHPEYDIWIPEMIFGHLRTSTNYKKNEKRIVGGKNGFGFKLVLIWSSYGKIETVDHTRGLKYVQEFKNNLDELCPPVITKISKTAKPYTKVTFIPDYKRFGINGMTSDLFSLLKKRVYDIAAVTDQSAKKVKLYFNDDEVKVSNFTQYINMYIGGKGECKRIHEKYEERWEYAVTLSPTHEFTQVSFVNGICTFKGGKHVDYILHQIVKKLSEYIEKKKKIKVNSSTIKEQIMLFVRCDIENPSFDSQTKDYMNTPINKFGSSCVVSDGFIDRIAKLGIMETAVGLTEVKDMRLVKKSDGVKTRSIRGIANFIDANNSGTQHSKDCILILCEGLSALSGIVSGLSSEDRNTIGIYPLKGKLLNVRGEGIKKIADNKEITDIKKILGLTTEMVYETLEDVNKHLRYGKIMILCDQDTDGSHIKGLCINLFHSEWASLIKIPGFISFMNTPILRAKKGNTTKLFYNEGEYETWKNNNNTAGWTIKYFKGLGTSTSKEFKEYFANKKIVDFVYTGPESDDIIDKIFNKKRANERKTWLENYDKNSYLDTTKKNVKYDEFINNELIHFSSYDCARSIPCGIDGLKISLRKILYCAFKRKLNTEVKVAQFSGYVSEHSSYHHGEASLNGAIVNMAQTYVGSNNINLLMPNGQFGTRLHGGDDSASERYIFTQLNPLTRYIFPELDDNVLNYLNDDGTMVEPDYYIPIIPFALINGISGIGTGFSCNITPFNPKDITHYLKNKLNGKSNQGMIFFPYYQGFKGTIRTVEDNDKKYLIKGLYQKVDNDTINILELPIGTWTMPYTSFLESLMDGHTDKNGKRVPPSIRDFSSLSTEVNVMFKITFPRGKLSEYESTTDSNGINGVEKLLKLTTTVSNTNIHMFNSEGKLRKYNTVPEIIDDYYDIRLDVYDKRKKAMIKSLEEKLVKLSNRARYILETLDNKIDLRRKSNAVVNDMLENMKFDKIDDNYKYLVKMPMDSVTTENVEHIVKEKADTEKELSILKSTSLEKMWNNELDEFEKEYEKYKTYRVKLQTLEQDKVKSPKKVTKPKAKK